MATNPADLAVKIATKAKDALEPLAREMHRNEWPGEFRRIMWQAVIDTAQAELTNIR